MEKETIYFYDKSSEHVKEEHIFLNNFAISPIEINGSVFQTVEHFYQASKFKEPEKFELIRNAPTADAAKKLAYTFEFDRLGWEAMKDQVMYQALVAKFEQNPDLLAQLLRTGTAKFVEYSLRDAYWGGIIQGSRNRLGEMLEEIREKFQSRLNS